MKNPIKYYKDLVYRIADQSECRSREVGAIAVREGIVICEGWNSPPTKCNPEDCIRCNNKDKGIEIPTGTMLEQVLCAHAEVNLIGSMARFGIAAQGLDMYCKNRPCGGCAAVIAAARFANVYYFEEYHNHYTDLIFEKAKINCQKVIA